MLRQGAVAASTRLVAHRLATPCVAKATMTPSSSSSSPSYMRSSPSLFSRLYSSGAEAVAQVPTTDAIETPPVGDNIDNTRAFASLEGKINPFIVEALTGEPFNYETMSEVQYQVTKHIDEIVAPVKGTAPLPGAQVEAENDAATSKGPTDLLVKAKTGTGKTLAFLMPAIEARLRSIAALKRGTAMTPAFRRLVQKNQPNFDFSQLSQSQKASFANKTYTRNSVGALIISPTRELATQIAEEAKKLGRAMGRDFNVHTLVGGANKRDQLRDWSSKSLDVVVGTPGRLEGLLQESATVRSAMSATETLIFDEADTLLEMGFKDSIDAIVEQLPPKEERRTMLFSATVPREIREVAQNQLTSRRRFIDCVPEGESNTHENIKQTAYVVKPEEQFPAAMRLLAQDQLLHGSNSRVIVFCPTTKLTQLTTMLLKDRDTFHEFPINVMPPTEDAANNEDPDEAWGGSSSRGRNDRRGGRRDRDRDPRRRPPSGPPPRVEIYEMHSKLSQERRDRVANRFRRSPGASILVTSDLSARGVDYPNVTRVIQVDLPRSKDQYVHRIGRTGRAGKSGVADMLILEGWQDAWPAIEGQGLPITSVRNGGKVIREALRKEWENTIHKRGLTTEGEKPGLDCALPASESLFCATGEDALESRVIEYMRDQSNFDSVDWDPNAEKNARDRRSGGRGRDNDDVPVFGGENNSFTPENESPLRHLWVSSMGYWVGCVQALRISKNDLYRGAQDWAKGALALSHKEATLSRNLMQKLGITEGGGGGNGFGGQRGRGGGGRGGGGYRDRDSGYGSRGGYGRGGDREMSRSGGGGWGPYAGTRESSYQPRKVGGTDWRDKVAKKQFERDGTGSWEKHRASREQW